MHLSTYYFERKAYFILFCISLLYCNLIIAQSSTDTASLGRVTISSPTAAALGKYGDFPVSYNTGMENINIPLYTIKSSQLSLPISLSYHASGLRVQEYASWVGAGWSLNAGGMITRAVRGAADDMGFQNYAGFSNNCLRGYYADSGFQTYTVHGSDTSQYNFLVASADGFFEQNLYDGEPDMFNFNFSGHSGKFYFNDDQSAVITPDEDLKIQPYYVKGPGFNGFIITTSDGVQYYFGKTGNFSSGVDPLEWSLPAPANYGPSNSNAAASSWFLNKIISADGTDSITFNYTVETYSTFSWALFPIKTSLATTIQDKNGIDYIKTFINGLRLTQIKFSNGIINFTPSASPRTDVSAGYPNNTNMTDNTSNTTSFSLGSISITNNNGYCKKDSFYYSYFVDNVNTDLHNTCWGTSLDNFNVHCDRNTLRLDSLQESSCDQVIKIPPYKFSYFSELVPRKLSLGMDHWGFSNGVTTNYNLIPSYTNKTISNVITPVPGANRDASWPAMRGGSLQKITYPTGGYTSFNFEPHSTYCNYSTYNPNNVNTSFVGYDGSSQKTTSWVCNSSDTYQLILTSNQSQYGGYYQIIDPSLNVVQSLNAVIGGSDTLYFTLNQGTTYTLKLVDNQEQTGYGIYAYLSDMVQVQNITNVTVGGLRIKADTTSDGINQQKIVKNYGYTISNINGGQSSGILYSRPVYVQYVDNKVFDNLWGTAYMWCTHPTPYISPSSVRPMETVQGNHIGYNEVYVSQTGNGYSQYKYYGSSYWDFIVSDVCTRYMDASNFCFTGGPNLPAAPPSFDYMRGELKYEAHYNQRGQLLQDNWHFPLYNQDSLTTTGHICAFLPNGMTSYTEYALQSATKVRDSIVSTTYDPSTNTNLTSISTTYFKSSYHHSPTQKLTYSSTGDTLKTNLLYTFDFQNSSFFLTDSLSYFLNLMKSDTTAFISALTGCPANEPPTISTCKQHQFTIYRGNVSYHRQQFIAYRWRCFNLYNSTHSSSKSTAGTELKPIYELQDEYQNPVIEQSNWKNSSLIHSNFTRYDYVSNPSGKVAPNKTQLVNLAIPSTTFTNAIISGSTINKDSRYLDEATFQFNAGNVQQVNGKDGITYSYIWDYLNTQPIAKITNATSDQVAYTSFETSAGGGWTIPSGLRNTTAITGNQSYSLSNGACSKSGLVNANKYIVSYWSSTGAAYTVTGSTNLQQGPTINGWTYFEHIVSGTSSVSVSGTGNIDELRLYPKVALMTTYTYTPLVGMTSSCDENNRITYYFFDQLGRLRWQKDKDGNIVKTIQYHYKAQTTNQ